VANLAGLVRDRGDRGRAQALFAEGLTLCELLGERYLEAACLEGLVIVACDLGDNERAARLAGAVASLRTAIGAPQPQLSGTAYEAAMAKVLLALGDTAFAAAWDAGRAVPLKQAIAEALEMTEPRLRRTAKGQRSRAGAAPFHTGKRSVRRGRSPW